MYNVSFAYMALIRNRNNPNHISNIKFNGGRLVDHPINTDIDVGAVAPWIRIIPTHPQISGILLVLIILNLSFWLWLIVPYFFAIVKA